MMTSVYICVVYCMQQTMNQQMHCDSWVASALHSLTFSPLHPSYAYMCQWTVVSLVQVMACHLFAISPSLEPLMPCGKLNFWSARLKASVPYIDGFVQETCNSIANALELHLSCTSPLICSIQNSTAQANFLPTQLKMHSHWRAGEGLVSLTVMTYHQWQPLK